MSCEHCTDPDVIVKAGLDAILAWIQKGADELLIRRIWDDVRRAMLEAGKQSDVILVDPRRMLSPRTSWIHEYPDGARRLVSTMAPMRHVKTGGKYIVTAFPIREATMEQGFDYFSILTKETFWRPIGELFDGRFEFITMEELCSTN